MTYREIRMRFEEIWPYVEHGTTLDSLLRRLQVDVLATATPDFDGEHCPRCRHDLQQHVDNMGNCGCCNGGASAFHDQVASVKLR